MRIIVDGKPLLGKRAGIGKYTYNLLQGLSQLDHKNEYFLYGVNNLLNRTRLHQLSDPMEFDQALSNLIVRIPFPFKKMVQFITSTIAQKTIKQMRADLFWATNYLGIIHDSFKTIITIHDMAYKYYPENIHPTMYKYLSRNLYDHAQRAHAIIADSECTKRDVMKFLEIPSEKIQVIYSGVNSMFRPIHDTSILNRIRRKYHLPSKIILFVGTLEPRKNIVGLIQAYKELIRDLKSNYSLVIVGGKGWAYKDIFKTVGDLKIKDRIVFTGYVPDEDLPAIYNLGDVFVYPSFYEGFGMPVVEAMACGVPVITSNLSSLPEVGGDAVLYVSPGQTEEIAHTIKSILTDEKLRVSLKEKGLIRSKSFTWENAARQVLKVFDTVMNEGSKSS